jgi:hypothetical protein
MNLNDFFKKKISERLGVPKEQITTAFVEGKLKAIEGSLQPFSTSRLGGSIANSYLEQTTEKRLEYLRHRYESTRTIDNRIRKISFLRKIKLRLYPVHS